MIRKFLIYPLAIILSYLFLLETVSAYNLTPAFSKEKGYYVGGLVGTTISGGGMSNEFDRGVNGFAWDVSAGYMFNATWGMEAGYMRQQLDGSVVVVNSFMQMRNVDISTYLTITYLTARLNIPIVQPLTLIAKAGAMYADRPSITATANINGSTGTTNISDNSGVSAFVGLGLSYAVSSKLALVFQWQGPYVSDSYGLFGLGLEYYFE